MVGISGYRDDFLNHLTISFFPAPSVAIDGAIESEKLIKELKPTTIRFGKGQGDAFDVGNLQSIALRYSSVIDSINLNGDAFGGSGGDHSTSLEMADGESISAFAVGWGEYDYVFSLRFTTNMGRSIHGGESIRI